MPQIPKYFDTLELPSVRLCSSLGRDALLAWQDGPVILADVSPNLGTNLILQMLQVLFGWYNVSNSLANGLNKRKFG